MTAKQAANKILTLGGTVTKTYLIRYGVTAEDADTYMRWLGSKSGKKRMSKLKKYGRKEPIIYSGYNSVSR